MSYSKPELLHLSSSIQAIQGINKPPCTTADRHTGDDNATPGAYEADE